jgi:hypothetical protein
MEPPLSKTVQIIENWVIIEGIIIEIKEKSDLENFSVAVIKILKIIPFEEFPDLISNLNEDKINVFVRKECLPLLHTMSNEKIACNIRRANKNRLFMNEQTVHLI